MPPRYAYWTIIAGNLPTAFRSARRDELVPTFRRLKEKHPDAVMKWFARGRLWESPDAAREELMSRRNPTDQRRSGRSGPRSMSGGPSQSGHRDWRPGGDHRDPRQRYKDAKRQRNIDRRRSKFVRQHGDPSATEYAARSRRGAPNVPVERERPERSSHAGGEQEPRQRPRTRDAGPRSRNATAPSSSAPRGRADRPRTRFRR